MKHRDLVLVAITAVVILGCGDSSPLSPASQPGELGSSPSLKVEGPAHIDGEIGPGAHYEVDIPVDWNGDLVLYAHGYRDPLIDVSEETNAVEQLLRGDLLTRGFGFGWTSYSENGFAVRDGAQRVHQLRGVFTSRFGVPNKTYVIGTSMGGLIALELAERHPSQYAGALLRCGIISGNKPAVDYIWNIRALFDYFFPGVLPGDALTVPVGLSFNADVVPAAVPAILSNLPAARQCGDSILRFFRRPGSQRGSRPVLGHA
jgi:pimeloyl-ACP methyl ester carboxylesterase